MTNVKANGPRWQADPLWSRPAMLPPTRRFLGWMVVLFCLLSPTSAGAVPFDVESNTRIKIAVRDRGLTPIVEGRVVDNVNQGIGETAVTLEIQDSSGNPVVDRVIQTDYLGYLREQVQLPAGQFTAIVRFEPESGHRPAAMSVPFETSRKTLSLSASAPDLVHMSQNGTFRVELSAKSPWVPIQPVTVEVAVGEGSQVFRKTVALNPNRPPVTLPVGAKDKPVELVGFVDIPQRLVPRGQNAVDIVFLGDNRFELAELQEETFLFLSPRMKFTAEVIQERDRRGISVSGELLSADGPLNNATIQAEVAAGRSGFEAVGELFTEEDGRFRGFIPADRVPPGEVNLRMAFIPDVGAPLRSKPVVLDVDPSSATGWAMWLLIGLFGIVFSAMAIWFIWNQLSTWWQARKRRKPTSWTGESAPLLPAEVPSGTSTALDAISGFVVERGTDNGLSPAEIRLVPSRAGADSEALSKTSTDRRGFFTLLDLPRGKYQLVASAHGFMTGKMPLAIPHDGKYRCFKFELVSVRERVRELYQWLLEQYSPDLELWGWSTPREIGAEVVGELGALLSMIEEDIALTLSSRAREVLSSSSPDAGELLDLTTRLLEEVYYSERLFPEEIALLADRLVERLAPALRRAPRPRRRRFSESAVERSRRDTLFGEVREVGR